MEQRQLQGIGSFSRTTIRVALVALLVALPFALSFSGAEYGCEGSPVTIQSQEWLAHHDICDAAERVVQFFGRLNLELMNPLVIDIVPALPEGLSKDAVGCYDKDKQTVFVLAFSNFEKQRTWFGVPVSLSMYHSVVAHEVAHAVASCNFSIPDPTLHADEYAAYVAMFATMAPGLRAEVLAKNPGAGFECESEINEFTYAFDPMRFGVEAYRHYLRQENGDAFLLKTLSREALTNSVRDLP